jgi:DNA polymerase IIIc chi subunit
MKIFISLVISCFMALTCFAQYTITLKVLGNKNRKVILDARSYTLNNTNPKANNKNISITDLQPGTHTIQVVRANKTSAVTTSFTLRNGYDMTITVTGAGGVQIKEKPRPSATTDNGYPGMSTAAFNTLVQDVQNQWQAGAKLNMLNNAFANTGNYFTTVQARQLIQLLDDEQSRLQLAKASYRSITDKSNFTNIYALLTSQVSKNELSAYVTNYNNTTSGIHTAMNTATFNSLVQDIQNQWQAGAKYNMIASAYTTGNYFTTDQVRQLIQLVDDENSRLQLAKASYKTVVDPSNFSNIYSLLANQSSKAELSVYVTAYNNGNTATTSHSPMSAASFNSLLLDIQNQWQAGAKLNTIMSAFTVNNYFTSSQARQLIQLVDAEGSRLQLAKASYRTITDVSNFSTVYDLLNTQASRNELTAYINGNEVIAPANTTVKVPMADVNFQGVLNEVKSQWLPGSKMMTLQSIIDNTTNYFSTAQVRQLVSFVTVETNRLQLLKVAYRNVTDRTNFTYLYDLLANQSSRDELANYVNTYAGN